MTTAMDTPTPGTLLRQAFNSLPLLGEDIYLHMQATNLAMVDDFLMMLEGSLLREYHALERTPGDSAAFLSALSQLWIFGVYELIRTWRQRVREALELGLKLHTLPETERMALLQARRDQIRKAFPYSEGRQATLSSVIDKIATDALFVDSLGVAIDKTEAVFRRIEALRVHLAKHEIPKVKGSAAFAPGYGRIHMETGSIYYQFEVRQLQVDVLSRRDVADSCRDLILDRVKSMLPESVRAGMRTIPEIGYGAKQVVATLNDGRAFEDVFVLWDREVASVGQHPELPFDARDVVAVRASTLNEPPSWDDASEAQGE